MFDTSQDYRFIPEDDSAPTPEALKQRCLDTASLWVLKRFGYHLVEQLIVCLGIEKIRILQ